MLAELDYEMATFAPLLFPAAIIPIPSLFPPFTLGSLISIIVICILAEIFVSAHRGSLSNEVSACTRNRSIFKIKNDEKKFIK